MRLPFAIALMLVPMAAFARPAPVVRVSPVRIAKPAPKAAKASIKPAVKPAAKPAAKPAIKPAAKPAAKPAIKPAAPVSKPAPPVVDPPPTAPKPIPTVELEEIDPIDEEPATGGQAEAEADEIEHVDAEDAAGIDEAVHESLREMEEMRTEEEEAVPEPVVEPRELRRLGAANPLRLRAEDTLGRLDMVPELVIPVTVPLGDAGALVPELAGMDLAALKAKYDIPIEINEDVVDYIRFFQGKGRKWYTRWLERSKRWIPFQRRILASENAPQDLVFLSMIESGFSPYAYSVAKASGHWQFIPSTGKRYGLRDDFWVDERRDPVKAAHAAARYLKELYAEFGDWYLSWASYNAGEGKMRKAIKMYNTTDFWRITRAGHYLRPETKHYVPKLIAAAIVAKNPERFGFTDLVPEGPFEFDEVELSDATELSVVAEAAGVPVETVQELNPSLRRWCTPPARHGHGYAIKLPKGTKERFLAAFEKLDSNHRLTFRHHRVKRGETLAAIAVRYRAPVESILRVNGVRGAKGMRVGMDLIVPVSPELAANVADTGDVWKEPRRAKARVAPPRQPVLARGLGGSKAVALPAGKHHYVVRSGDTLHSISQRFGVAVDDLKRWNGIGTRGHKTLQVGRALVVTRPVAPTRGTPKKGRG